MKNKILFSLLMLATFIGYGQNIIYMDGLGFRPQGAPALPIRGEVYYSNADDYIYRFDGSVWSSFAFLSDIPVPQVLSLSTNTLSLTQGGGDIDLSQYLDDTTLSDAEVETAYNNQVATVSQALAEAGTSTAVYRWTPQRINQAIAALAGVGTDDQNLSLTGNTLSIEGGNSVDVSTATAVASAVQPGDNVSDLTNDAGYLTTETDDQTGSEVSVAATPTNYTAGTADVEAHLAGIDTELGTKLDYTSPLSTYQVLTVDASGNAEGSNDLTFDGTLAVNGFITTIQDPLDASWQTTAANEVPTKKDVDDAITAASSGGLAEATERAGNIGFQFPIAVTGDITLTDADLTLSTPHRGKKPRFDVTADADIILGSGITSAFENFSFIIQPTTASTGVYILKGASTDFYTGGQSTPIAGDGFFVELYNPVVVWKIGPGEYYLDGTMTEYVAGTPNEYTSSDAANLTAEANDAGTNTVGGGSISWAVITSPTHDGTWAIEANRVTATGSTVAAEHELTGLAASTSYDLDFWWYVNGSAAASNYTLQFSSSFGWSTTTTVAATATGTWMHAQITLVTGASGNDPDMRPRFLAATAAGEDIIIDGMYIIVTP